MLSDLEKIFFVAGVVMVVVIFAYAIFMKLVMKDFDAYLNKKLIEEQTKQYSISEIISIAPQKIKTFTNELMQSIASSPVDKNLALKEDDHTPLLFESPSEPPFGYV